MRSSAVRGLERMRALAVDLPGQLRAGFSLGLELEAPVPRDARDALAVGMGGSAVAADLAQSLTEPETELALGVVRGPAVPRAVGHKTIVVLVSYSGNTWETLSAYDAAGRQGAYRIILSSGGELAQRAEHDHVPHLPLPPGHPPRAALGYMLGGLLGILDPFFPESNEGRLQRAAARLAALQPAFASAGGEPARLARAVGERALAIYAPSEIVSIARRWKTQVEENAKRLAQFDALPELLHNALVAWDASPVTLARRHAVVVLERAGGIAKVGRSAAYLIALLRRRGVVARRVRLAPEDRLEAILTGVSFGDHVSLSLAEIAGVDPYEVRAIDRLKLEMSRPPRPRAPRSGGRRPADLA
jgi:glucose/mannose-6-phosphate isomerase